jgi:hypothetical protein
VHATHNYTIERLAAILLCGVNFLGAGLLHSHISAWVAIDFKKSPTVVGFVLAVFAIARNT